MPRKFLLALMITAIAMTALPVMAKNETSAKNSATTLNSACVQTAVEKRDTALLSAVDSYASAWKSALAARKDALKKAWELTTRQERMKAIKEAWKQYRAAFIKAKKDYNSERAEAWKSYRTDARACSPHVQQEDPTKESADNIQ